MRVMPSMDTFPSPTPGSSAPAETAHRWYPVGTHITVRGLTKRFDGVTVYEGFDLDIPKGRITSVFGPNG